MRAVPHYDDGGLGVGEGVERAEIAVIVTVVTESEPRWSIFVDHRWRVEDGHIVAGTSTAEKVCREHIANPSHAMREVDELISSVECCAVDWSFCLWLHRLLP